jgi:hypothetical protein
MPEDLEYQSLSDNIELSDFSWKLTSVPQAVSNYRNTSHFVIDSRKIHPDALSGIEDILYGTVSTAPRLPSVTELLSFVNIIVVDNGDGTWTATVPDYYLTMLDATTFQITNANALTIDVDTYVLASSSEYLDPDAIYTQN